MPAAPNQFLHESIIAWTIESLHAEHGRSRPWVYWIVLAGVALGLVALPLVKVDVTVSAPGMVRPSMERAELRVPAGAQVAQVLAHDNDHVSAGQTLLVFRSRDLQERLALNRTRERDKLATIADLEILTAEVDSLDFELSAHGSIALDIPKAKTESFVATANSPTPTSTLPLKTPELRADYAQVRLQLDARALATAKAARELKRNETLAAKGLIADHDLEQSRDDLAAARMEESTLAGATRSRWEARLRDEQSNLDTLRSEGARLAEESVQNTLRSPVAGALQGLGGLSIGTWLAAGQSVGTVSPDDQLIVETMVSPQDVGMLRTGQRARLQIDAFSYTQWGLLDGEILTIAADTSVPASANSPPRFKVILRPAATSLQLPNGAIGVLRKGMTLTARFVVARRSLLQILYEDVDAWLNPQGAHRGT